MRPLLSSKEMLIVFDNAESILDPKAEGAKEVYSIADELCQFKTICLCITSRITMVPPRCKRPSIPTLSLEAASDIFYGIYGDGERTSTINNLLEHLDFHALSIKLLATTASHNVWDHDRLAKEWDTQRAQVLQTDYNESLAATIELSLSSPTFQSLGPDTRDLLGVVAFFPQGVNENNIDWLFPTLPNRKNMFDKFCALSLTYRSNGFITMLAPIRDYLSPQDPQSSPLLCTTRDRYFTRLSVDIQPGHPGFEEARWIVLEDVNIEYLLDAFISFDQTRANNWDTCICFLKHLVWHKPRQTTLGSKIKALAEDHPFKLKCLFQLSLLFSKLGNRMEAKKLLTHTLELGRQWGDDVQVVETLRNLSNVNRLLGFSKEGIQQAEEALEILERINDTGGQAFCLENLARSLYYDQQFDAAENTASRAIGLVREKGQEHLTSRLHRVLGLIHKSKGEKEKAIQHFKTALRIASLFNFRDSLFWIHHDLALLFRNKGELDKALIHLEQAKSRTVDQPYLLGGAIYLQASVWFLQGRFEDAKTEALHSLEIFEKLGATRDAGDCRDFLRLVEQKMKTDLLVSNCEFLETMLHHTPIDASSSTKHTIQRLGE